MTSRILFLLLSFSISGWADATITATLQAGECTWAVGGSKKRSEIPNALLGSKTIAITSVLHGVEWKLDPDSKLYEEKPFGASRRGENSDHPGGAPVVKKTTGSKTFGGLSASGCEIELADGKIAILWLHQPNEALTRVQKDILAFQSVYLEKLRLLGAGSELPAEGEEALLVLHFLDVSLARKLQGVTGLPKGFPVALQVRGATKTDEIPLFEIKDIGMEPVDASLFTIPDGFKKVKNLMEEQIRGMGGQ